MDAKRTGQGLVIGFMLKIVREIYRNVRRLFFKLTQSPSNLTAFPFKMPDITSGLKPATSKSFIQRSGVING